MSRQRLQAFFLYLLCTVMLAVQGVPAHAHLDAVHPHGTSQHQHHPTVHAHQPVIGHDDDFGSGQAAPHADAVVELDQSFCTPCAFPDLAVIVRGAAPLPASASVVNRVSLPVGSSLPNRPLPHVGEPRAPPQQA